MNWGSFSNFVEMGGYGPYVWGSYALALALMGAEPWLVSRRHRRSLAIAARRSAAAEDAE